MIGVLAELERRTDTGRDEGSTAARGEIRAEAKLTRAQISKARKLIEQGERVEDVAALWALSSS
jgi:hypothetical protein